MKIAVLQPMRSRAAAPERQAAPAASATWERWAGLRGEMMTGGVRGGAALALLLGVSYLVLAQIVLRMNDPLQVGMNFWPAAGLTLGVLLLIPTRRWAWALVAIVVAEAASDFLKGHAFGVTFWLVVANSVEPLLGATLIRRFTTHRGALVPIQGLLEFIAFGVIAAPIVGGALGTVGTALAGADFLESWPKFIVGDALGVLVVAPVLLSVRRWKNDRPVRTAVAPAVATLVVSALALYAWPGGWDTVTPYLVIPPLTWAALRSGVRGAAWSILAMGQVANFAVANGTEPFGATGDTGYTVTLLQAYLGIVASTTLILASATSELSDRDAVEAALRHQALHDPLTGLPNRLYLLERLDEFLGQAREDGVAVAMCVIDLDSFKTVNDTFGHPVGDELLVASAQRLQGAVRSTDMVARVGGDEFVILLYGVTDVAIDAVTSRIVEHLSAPVMLLGRRINATVSVGVAFTDGDATFDDLYRDADAALYRAKALGRNQVARFAPLSDLNLASPDGIAPSEDGATSRAAASRDTIAGD